MTIDGTCDENGQAVTITGPNSLSVSTNCDGTNFSVTGVDMSALDEGDSTIYANMNDPSGNPATQQSTIVTKDTVLPTIALDAISGYVAIANEGSITVSGTCNENGAILFPSTNQHQSMKATGISYIRRTG